MSSKKHLYWALFIFGSCPSGKFLSNSIYLEIFILQQGRVQIILHICNIIIKCNHEMKFAFGEIIRVRFRLFWILIPLQHSQQGQNCSRLLPANGLAQLGARAQHRTLLMGKFCSGFPPTPISLAETFPALCHSLHILLLKSPLLLPSSYRCETRSRSEGFPCHSCFLSPLLHF